MLSRLGILLFVPLFLLTGFSLSAQEKDYWRHNKEYYLCSFKRDCSHCYDCGKQRYTVKIQNRTEKTMLKVYYVYYSSVYNRVLEKEAVLKGDKLEKKQIGLLNICVPDGLHWAITKISYDDGSTDSYVIKERLENFIQEPDECDCND